MSKTSKDDLASFVSLRDEYVKERDTLLAEIASLQGEISQRNTRIAEINEALGEKKRPASPRGANGMSDLATTIVSKMTAGQVYSYKQIGELSGVKNFYHALKVALSNGKISQPARSQYILSPESPSIG